MQVRTFLTTGWEDPDRFQRVCFETFSALAAFWREFIFASWNCSMHDTRCLGLTFTIAITSSSSNWYSFALSFPGIWAKYFLPHWRSRQTLPQTFLAQMRSRQTLPQTVLPRAISLWFDPFHLGENHQVKTVNFWIEPITNCDRLNTSIAILRSHFVTLNVTSSNDQFSKYFLAPQISRLLSLFSMWTDACWMRYDHTTGDVDALRKALLSVIN